MTVPVTGLLYDAYDEASYHSHNLYITTWDGQPVHSHHIKGITSFDVGHEHRYSGTTERAPSGISHTHRYFTYTTINSGHKHVIKGVTGPDIPLPGGGHYHEFSGVTTVDGATPHRHQYSGRTSM
nr:YmaF family protein [Halalkalibacterium ligniniphilum]